MLTMTIPPLERESFNDETGEFIYTTIGKEVTLHLEHSLVSLSKWESKFHKPFISKKEEMTLEENIYYVKCMTLDKNIDPEVYNRLTADNLREILDYTKDPMTATTFRKKDSSPNREPTTSELIYYWMIANNIPVEFEKWHLNRLLALIRVCSIKNSPPKKMSKKELMERNAALNAKRWAEYEKRKGERSC